MQRFNPGRSSSFNVDPEFEEKIVQVNRVSKKTKGGNKIGFSVLMVVGDRKGRVGVGLGKAPDVQSSIRKASSYAKKHLITVPLVGTTIPHETSIKLGAARIIFKPAAPGTGVIAGGSVRAVVEAAGIKDILSKALGTNNKTSNVYATLEALKNLRPYLRQVKEPQAQVELSDTEAKVEKEVEVSSEKPKSVKKAKITAKVKTKN